MPTKTGFLILQVGEHYPAGQQPEDKVDNEIKDRLYNEKMKPALREYLEMLREDSYVQVKPGYTDTAAVAGTAIDEVAADARRRRQKKERPQSSCSSARKRTVNEIRLRLRTDARSTITSFFLVCEKELRSTREGKPFLRLELSDRSGTIEARVWENAEQVAATFDRDDIVKVQARVESYKTRCSLRVDKIAPRGPRRSGSGGLFSAHRRGRREALHAGFCEHAAAVEQSLAQPAGRRA